MQAETSMQGASAVEMARDNAKAEANISTEAIATDVAAAPDVFRRVVFVGLK
jgi:hypothetical protein